MQSSRRGIKEIQSLYRELRFQGIQSYWEKVIRDTNIIQGVKVSRDAIILGEGFKGYNHYTGRRFQGIQSLYREKVSRDTIILGEGLKGYNYTGRGIKGIQSLYRELRFQGIQSYWEKD